MHCPRLDHFVRFNHNGTVSRCGHMTHSPQFANLEEMESSVWLQDMKLSFDKNIWPKECIRCQQTEEINQSSIRRYAINFDKLQNRDQYLTVGGVLDNVCNSACFSCSEQLSTKIGSLKSKSYPIIDNSSKFWKLPLDRVVHLDINGGEPSASKNYRYLLQNIPPNVKSIRINTNCSLIIDEIENLINAGIKVTVTVSLDGIDDVHDFVRWPIKWDKFYKNLMHYKSMDQLDLNTWTTVSALNIHNFTAIRQFVANHQLAHDYAFLHSPDPMNVKYQNNLTLPYKTMFPGIVAVDKNNQEELDTYISEQKKIRGIV